MVPLCIRMKRPACSMFRKKTSDVGASVHASRPLELILPVQLFRLQALLIDFAPCAKYVFARTVQSIIQEMAIKFP
jgi:hypothetical protein